MFFWRNQRNITREEVILITVQKEIAISKKAHENYQFDKTVFFALAGPLLFIASFLTLHLADIFQIQGLLTVILTSSYILLLIPIYKISILKINKQNKNFTRLKEMIIVDYKTCRFCGKQLSIKEFYNTNKNADLQKISTIWNSDFYGLMCCNCFENTPSKFWIKIKQLNR